MLTVLPIPALSVAHAAGRPIINMEVQRQDDSVGTSPKPPAITSEASSNSASPQPVPPHADAAVPPHSDADADAAEPVPQTAEQAPSDGWPAPPPVHPACFWSDDHTFGITDGGREQSSAELRFFLEFLGRITSEYINNSPILGCDPEVYPVEFQQGFQMGCQVRKAFVQAMVQFELKAVGYRMQRQMLNYMPDNRCMPLSCKLHPDHGLRAALYTR